MLPEQLSLCDLTHAYLTGSFSSEAYSQFCWQFLQYWVLQNRRLLWEILFPLVGKCHKVSKEVMLVL